MAGGLLNVMNDSKAWYFVIVESFLNKWFSLLIIELHRFLQFLLHWFWEQHLKLHPKGKRLRLILVVSQAVSEASPYLNNFQPTAYVLHLERDGGVLELFEAIL